MIEAGTVQVKTADTADDAVVTVRFDASTVALGISLMSDGDVEVVLHRTDAIRVLSALQKAVGQMPR